MAEIVGIRFKREGKQYYFSPEGLTVAVGEGVILETSRGIEFGICARANTEIPEEELAAPLRPILRLATPEDYEILARNRLREQEAMALCQKKIEEHGLDMKLVDVEYSFEGSKILFFFTSEGRVDFRALVKDLAAVFHTRIELRQIGVRDEAKMLGGLGICGRPFCCSSFLREFQPVSIKMAKTQNLSLNPAKISGTCGRLMCCLKYEQHAYEDLLKTSPRADSFVETPDGVGDIISVHTLREKVRVRLDSEPDSLKTYHNSEIRVIRAGKGKRPEDYSPPPLEALRALRRPEERQEPPALGQQPAFFGVEPQLRSEAMPAAHRDGEEQEERRGRRPRSAPRKETREAKPARKEKPEGKPAQKPAKPPEESGKPAGKEAKSPARRGRKPAAPGKENTKNPPEKALPDAVTPPPAAAKAGEKSGEKKNRGYWRRRPRRSGGGKPNSGE